MPIINKIPTLKVKIADTPEAQSRGLMFVKSMPNDTGMLFVFGRKQVLSFWGENTLLPLDIAFADEKGLIVKIDRISPMSRKSVTSSSPCKYAIEANVGYFIANGIKVGDKVLINNKESSIIFAKKNSKEYSLPVKQSQALPSNDESQFSNLGEYFDHYDQTMNQDKNIQDENLPVLGQDEIGQYLEDSIEEQNEMQDENGLPQEEEALPEELENVSPEELEDKIPLFNNISDAFNWGQENKQVMKITYQTVSKTKGTRMFGNNVITRYIEPHGRFTSTPENGSSHEVLVTFDETIGGIRAFRMQNVKQFSFVGKEFNPKFIVR